MNSSYLWNLSLEEDQLAKNDDFLLSNYFLEQARKINIMCVSFILVIGLIGNCLTIVVFAQKRFRINSSNVYLLSLAVIDGLFLLLHLFEVNQMIA